MKRIAAAALACLLFGSGSMPAASAQPSQAPQRELAVKEPQEQQGNPQPPVQPQQPVEQTGVAAIVIDDFGNDMEGTKEMMELPVAFTAAVMPFLPTTKRDAEWAHRQGREVIVHLPMEPLRGPKSWLGPNPITTDLSDDEIRRRVVAAIEDVPYAVGMNNHMGSKATVDERVMNIVLDVCRERGLIFLDSHTNYRSIVSRLAKAKGVRAIENQLFFDDSSRRRDIARQVSEFQKRLEENHQCVAIGHVGRAGLMTAAVLKESLPRMSSQIRFVSITKMIEEEAGAAKH